MSGPSTGRARPEAAKVRKVRSQLLVTGSIGAGPEGIAREDAAHRDECGGVGEAGEVIAVTARRGVSTGRATSWPRRIIHS
jgi:hypothetical protein